MTNTPTIRRPPQVAGLHFVHDFPDDCKVLFVDRGPLSVLDIGCGHAKYRQFINEGGHRYLGVDLHARKPDVRVDAHELPFTDSQFDAALLFSVLQYSLTPQIVLAEARRVIKPGGSLTGSIAFLEPAIWEGLTHLSASGLVTLLDKADFEIEYLWPSWNVFEAVASAMRQSHELATNNRAIIQKVSELGTLCSDLFDAQLDFSGAFYFHAIKSNSTSLR